MPVLLRAIDVSDVFEASARVRGAAKEHVARLAVVLVVRMLLQRPGNLLGVDAGRGRSSRLGIVRLNDRRGERPPHQCLALADYFAGRSHPLAENLTLRAAFGAREAVDGHADLSVSYRGGLKYTFRAVQFTVS